MVNLCCWSSVLCKATLNSSTWPRFVAVPILKSETETILYPITTCRPGQSNSDFVSWHDSILFSPPPVQIQQANVNKSIQICANFIETIFTKTRHYDNGSMTQHVSTVLSANGRIVAATNRITLSKSIPSCRWKIFPESGVARVRWLCFRILHPICNKLISATDNARG